MNVDRPDLGEVYFRIDAHPDDLRDPVLDQHLGEVIVDMCFHLLCVVLSIPPGIRAR